MSTTTAERVVKPAQIIQHKSAQPAFFRKTAGDQFFGNSPGNNFFSPSYVQTKLTVSQPGDPFEKEADTVADKVMRTPEPSSASLQIKDEEVQTKNEAEYIQAKMEAPLVTVIQRKEKEEEKEEQEKSTLMVNPKGELVQCREDGSDREEKVLTKSIASVLHRKDDELGESSSGQGDTDVMGKVFRKNISLFHSETVQRSGRGPPVNPPAIEQQLLSSKGGGQPLPEDTKSFMEERFQSDFSAVRIHTDSNAEHLSRTMHAHAFTHGGDIYFNSGKYNTASSDGNLLLAHELTHTIQQGASQASKSSVQKSPSISSKVQRFSSKSNSSLIQLQSDSVPQLTNAVALAKTKEGKVNAKKEGPDGFREGWQDLLEFFKITFGEDKIISGAGGGLPGTVAEMDIKKKRDFYGLVVDPANTRNTKMDFRDAMPSWCGIFAFWALNKGGVPMPKWKLGERIIDPKAGYPPGYTPKAGDIAYRNAYSHFALVEKSDGNTVTTINGNTAGEDKMGGQIQSLDHPISEWTAFFNPLIVMEGSLATGEGPVNAKPKTFAELRKELFKVNRKEENEKAEENENINENEIQTKLQNNDNTLSNNINKTADTHSAISSPTVVQSKEKEDEEEKENVTAQPSLQMKHASGYHLLRECADCEGEQIQAKSFSSSGTELTGINSEPYPNSISAENGIVKDRGPPLSNLNTSGTEAVQRDVIDDAISYVSGISDCISTDLDEAKTCVLRKAQQAAMHIPGYKALRVVLGEDPITSEDVERNGHNFIEAAFDIMPGGSLLHQKLDEQHQLDAAAEWIDSKLSDVETLVNDLFSAIEQFVNSLGLSDVTSPMDVLRRGVQIVFGFIDSVIDFAVKAAVELLEMVKKFLLSKIVEFIKEKTTAYPLLTVILGKDPITEEQVDRNGTNILNALLEFGGEEGIMQRDQMKDTGTFDKVAAYIDEGISVFGDLYDAIVKGFKNIWDYVSIENLMDPIETFGKIYNEFADPVKRVIDFVIKVVAEILRLVKDVLFKRISAEAKKVRGYYLVTVIIGTDPFTGEEVPRNVENIIHGFMSLMDGGEEQFQQMKESGAIAKATAKINAAVKKLNMTPASIIQLFIDLWNSFTFSDFLHPIETFKRIIATFGEPIGRLIAFVVEIIKIVVEVILIIMNFPFDTINNIIANAMKAFELIKKDPIGFLKNLLKAIKEGFIQFFNNILKHLLSGLVGWLTSELKDAGVPEITDLSLKGVIIWVLEVLGISMEKIWEKLAQHPRIGPAKVAKIRGMIDKLTGIWTFIKDVQERGMAAIWDKIQEQLSNLWNIVLDSIKNWIMQKIIEQVVVKLLSMLDPTGIMAVINSAIAIYKAIQSFIKYLREMLEIVNSFVAGIAEVASGVITKAANFLENSLAKGVPIVIGFLANQVGLSGIGKRIGELIGKARELVDSALTWLVNKAVDTAFDVIDKVIAFGKSAAETVLGWLGVKKKFTVNEGESHTLSFNSSRQVVMASNGPVVFGSFVNSIVIPVNKQEKLNPVKAAIIAKLQEIDGFVADTTLSDAVKETKIQAALEVIGPKIAELMRMTSGALLRSEAPQYGGLHGGFGSSMRVRVVDGQPATSGGQPSVAGGHWDNIKKRKSSAGTVDTFYIRAHLLNDNLGGPGDNWQNLSILSQQANNRDWYGSGSHMDVESRLKGPLSEEGKAFIYVVTANYGRGRNTSLITSIDDLINHKNNPLTFPAPAAPAYLNAYTVPQLTDIKNIVESERFVPTSFVCTIKEIDPSTGKNVTDSDHNITHSVSNDISGEYYL